MVKDERTRSPKKDALEVLRKNFGSKKKKLLDGLSSEFHGWAEVGLDPRSDTNWSTIWYTKLKCNNKID